MYRMTTLLLAAGLLASAAVGCHDKPPENSGTSTPTPTVEPAAPEASPEPAASEAHPTPASASQPESAPPPPRAARDQVVVKLAEGRDEAALREALAGLDLGEVELRPSILGRFVLAFPAADPPRDEVAQAALVEQVLALPAVGEAEANATVAGPDAERSTP